jgi:hypothetical protein
MSHLSQPQGNQDPEVHQDYKALLVILVPRETQAETVWEVWTVSEVNQETSSSSQPILAAKDQTIPFRA